MFIKNLDEFETGTHPKHCVRTRRAHLTLQENNRILSGQIFSQIGDPALLNRKINYLLIILSAIYSKFSKLNKEELTILKKANETYSIEDKIKLIEEVLINMLIKMSNREVFTKTIVKAGPQSKVYVESVDESIDQSINIIGNLQTDIGKLRELIEKEYKEKDKKELIQTIDQMKQYCNDPSKRKFLYEKLCWILTKTAEFSSITSLVITILQRGV